MGTEELKVILDQKIFEDDGVRKLRCSDAFELSAEHQVEVGEIGRICNEAGIRICGCQLGCFK